jgi:hypothetical protein
MQSGHSMPIKKRSAIPVIAKGGRRADGDLPSRLPGKPLSDLLKEYQRAQSDADWRGDFDLADDYLDKIKEVQARIDAGELYEVDF